MAELKTLGRYTLDRVLGKGAMGVVYEATDPRLNRRVAVKTILKSSLDEDTAKDFALRFVREAQAVARLNHPHIVQVHDFGEEGDVAYLVMELIRGKELKKHFDANERFALKEGVRIMVELLEALDFAHRAGIVHRDVKPGNVMLDGNGRTKLADFGVARVLGTGRTQGSQGGTMVGTPAYMSPEQITGAAVDGRSDVFSAGIILYQFLTGEQPFAGGGAWTVAKKIMQDQPPPPSALNSSVSTPFDAVVNKALAKSPDRRFQSAREFAAGLRRALEGKLLDDTLDQTVSIVAPPEFRSLGLASNTMPAPTQDAEVEFWRSIKDGDDAEDFELYIEQFPTGIYARLARRKIAKLRGVAPEETGPRRKEQEEQEEQEKREQEEALRREAEANASFEAEKAKLEVEFARREAAMRLREAEAEARRQAEARARAQSDAKARREIEAQASQQAAALAQAEAEAQARREAEVRERTEEWAKLAAQKARQDALVAKPAAEFRKHEAAEPIRPDPALTALLAGTLLALIGVAIWFLTQPETTGQDAELQQKAEARKQAEITQQREAEHARQAAQKAAAEQLP
jgi:serine/threonine protein kinase